MITVRPQTSPSGRMTPRGVHSYRQQTAQAWTRIDMLVATYDAAIEAVRGGRAWLQDAPGQPLPADRVLRVHQLLLVLIGGIDPETGPVARSVEGLLTACLGFVATPNESSWGSTVRVLEELREGFADIRDEARRLEQTGEIPPLAWQHCLVGNRV